MKELKIKGALSKDFQQIYIDDQATNLFVNEDGKFKTANILPDVSDGSLDIDSAKNISLKADADIALSAAGYNVTMDNGTTTTFDFNTNTTQLKMMSSADTADFCSITVAGSGATTISTTDDGAAVGHLTLDADGSVILDGVSTNIITGVLFASSGTTISSMEAHHSNTYLKLYENEGASTDDYFSIAVAANGATTIATIDAAGSAASLTLSPDGTLVLDPYKQIMAERELRIKEQAAAQPDIAAYGQIWIKDETPNELYFTTDAGDDIQITDGTAMAGGGGGDYYFNTSARARTQYNNWYYGLNVSYGYNYYYWVTSTGSTSTPSSYVDSFCPGYIVPKDGTVKAYTIIGNISTTDTWEWMLTKGAAPTYGSAGNYSVSQIGTTQSAGGTANILYKWEQTGLSVAVSAGDILIPYFRRTTDNDASYSYAEASLIVTLG